MKIKSARECPFLLFFAIFFTGGNSFSRKVQGFHGQYLINFHGRHFYFHGRNNENFHGRTFFVTGGILDQCYALNPPTPLFDAVFSKSLSMSNPPFLRPIFIFSVVFFSLLEYGSKVPNYDGETF